MMMVAPLNKLNPRSINVEMSRSTTSRKVLLAILLSLVTRVAGFYLSSRPFFGARGRQSVISPRSIHTATPADLSEILNGENPRPLEQQTDLWLDLRDTALHPRAAIDFLVEQLVEDELFSTRLDSGTIFDKILLSDTSFQNLVNAADGILSAFDILYTPIDAGFVALSTNGQSIPFGNRILVSHDASVAVADPMKAIETLSDGQWLIVEYENNDSSMDEGAEMAKVEALGNFLDIASTSTSMDWSGSSSTSDVSSLLVQGSSRTDESNCNGGVAVSCSTKSSIMSLSNAFRCLQSGNATQLSSSGILVPGENTGSTLPTALIIPLDVILWKTAMLVYGSPQLD